MVKIDINALVSEKQEIISIYKKQLDAFQHLRKSVEKVQWADNHYDQLVDSLNEIIYILNEAVEIRKMHIKRRIRKNLFLIHIQYAEQQEKL